MTSLCSLSFLKMLCHCLYTCAAVQFQKYGICVIYIYMQKSFFRQRDMGLWGGLGFQWWLVSERPLLPQWWYILHKNLPPSLSLSLFNLTMVNIKTRSYYFHLTTLFNHGLLLKKKKVQVSCSFSISFSVLYIVSCNYS